MKRILIASALSAFLGPGAGQLFNRKWKKGFLMMAGATAIFAAGVFVLLDSAKEMAVELAAHPEHAGMFKAATPEQMTINLIERNKDKFTGFKWAIIALWCYGIVDAYLDAKNRSSVKTPENIGDQQ